MSAGQIRKAKTLVRHCPPQASAQRPIDTGLGLAANWHDGVVYL